MPYYLDKSKTCDIIIKFIDPEVITKLWGIKYGITV